MVVEGGWEEVGLGEERREEEAWVVAWVAVHARREFVRCRLVDLQMWRRRAQRAWGCSWSLVTCGEGKCGEGKCQCGGSAPYHTELGNEAVGVWGCARVVWSCARVRMRARTDGARCVSLQ